jgi:hypothetical protein
VITPEPMSVTFPTFLDLPPPILRGYTPETVLAEKIEAMVTLGERNSRMKDFYDIHLLSRTQSFSGATLREAIEKTFAQRDTAFPATLPVLLTDKHPVLAQKQIQWAAFRRKNQLKDCPESFQEVAAAVRQFVEPIVMPETFRIEINWSPERGWGAKT